MFDFFRTCKQSYFNLESLWKLSKSTKFKYCLTFLKDKWELYPAKTADISMIIVKKLCYLKMSNRIKAVIVIQKSLLPVKFKDKNLKIRMIIMITIICLFSILKIRITECR